jgi:anaerobic selenocysteine-containing dehydrogenase
MQPDFRTAHYLDGFAWPDGKFRLKPDWANTPFANIGLMGPWREMPKLPDHWAVTEAADAAHPFRLATSPARNFLNSSFTETPTSLAREGRPTVGIHPEDAAARGVAEGDLVVLSNQRGRVRLHARLFDGVQRGVLISEGVWPNHRFIDGQGINMLTGDDSVAPFGGAAVHDTRVDLRRA